MGKASEAAGVAVSGAAREFYPLNQRLIRWTGLQSSGSLAGIRTPDLLGHYSKCSAGLSYERIAGQVGFQPFSVGRHEADGGCLSRVGRVFFDNQHVSNLRKGEPCGECAQRGLVSDMQGDSVSVAAVLFDERLAGSVYELGGLYAEREIGADDAVVRQVLVNGNACAERTRKKSFGQEAIT